MLPDLADKNKLYDIITSNSLDAFEELFKQDNTLLTKEIITPKENGGHITYPLLLAAHCNAHKILLFILENNPLLARSQYNQSGLTVLHITINELLDFYNNKRPIPPELLAKILARIKVLLSYLTRNYLDINRPNNIGQTPLMLAAWLGNLEMVKLLISNRANLKLISNDSFTPLMYATKNIGWGWQIAKLLLEKNPRLIDKQNIYGQTALLLAAYKNNTDVVNVLIASGADPNIKSHDHKSMLDYFSFHQFSFLILKISLDDEMLFQRKRSLFAFLSSNSCFETALNSVLPNNHTLEPHLNETPLMFAIRKKDDAVIKLLLDHGANLATENSSSKTAFDVAKEIGFLADFQNILKERMECPKKNQNATTYIHELFFQTSTTSHSTSAASQEEPKAKAKTKVSNS